ncbi:alpha/beta hydrolase, partial [Pediococcus acidilactici]|nr:alpha/beta hydrolase [Pediococcus acidilactici]
MQIIKTPLNQVNPQSQAELISYVDPSLIDALNPSVIFVPGGSYTDIDFKQCEKVEL